MIHNIEAIYDHGVFRPTQPLALPEGARVHLRVGEDTGRSAESPKGTTDYEAWLHGMAGRWHGEFERGNEGDAHSALLSVLDHTHNIEPIGSLRREELYDADNLC